LIKLVLPASSSPTTAIVTSGRLDLEDSCTQEVCRQPFNALLPALIHSGHNPASIDHTSSLRRRDRERFGVSRLVLEDPSSSSNNVCPTLAAEVGLRPASDLYKPPSGADKVRLPMPGRCGTPGGIACALSLDARARRVCWALMAAEIARKQGGGLEPARRDLVRSGYCVYSKSSHCVSIVDSGNSGTRVWYFSDSVARRGGNPVGERREE
jgi:hypothetical protein